MLLIGLPLLLGAVLVGSVSLSDRNNGAIVSAGEKREYLLYVPKSYDSTKPTPLVLSIHAAMNWPAYQAKISQWNEAADANGFIVVYPGGQDPLHLGPKAWFMDGSDSPSTMPDVRFISELMDTLQARYNIDPTRIYATGMSNGAGMTFALSCTLSHRIAAFGAVSAAQSLPSTWCADSTPVPMIAFHGTADPFVAYNGAPPGWLNPKPFPSVSTWTADWAKRNRCEPNPVDSAVAADVSRREYTNCAKNAAVVLYTIEGGGHQWPGGKPIPEWIVGRMSNGVDATDRMWAFFREHPLQRN